MARIANEGNQIADAGKRFAENVKAMFKGEAIERVEKPRSVVGTIVGAPARAGLWVVEQPIALAMKPVKWLANAAANHPRLALGSALLAGGIAAGNWLHNKREAEAQEAYSAQIAAMSQPSPYMNSVSPEEYAQMQYMMANRDAAGGFAARATNSPASNEIGAA